MLGKSFQRTVSMAQIGPAGTSCNPNTDHQKASAMSASASTDQEQQNISQWEILKHAEEMMMMMMASTAPQAGSAQAEAAMLQQHSHCSDHERPAGFIPRVNFLDNCFFCKRRLKHERDIFIYRGDAAFCTEECRQRQIMKDEMRSVGASSKKGGSSTETAVAA